MALPTLQNMRKQISDIRRSEAINRHDTAHDREGIQGRRDAHPRCVIPIAIGPMPGPGRASVCTVIKVC